MPKIALIVIAQKNYQDVEESDTAAGLAAAGFAIARASADGGACMGKLGGTLTADFALEDVHAGDFDRIAFIGGPGAAAYAKHPEALRLAQEAAGLGMPLGAICIGPTILAAAGVLKGKRATVWNEDGEQAGVIQAAGAAYTGEPVTVDGRIVTGNGPDAAEEFGRTLAAL